MRSSTRLSARSTDTDRRTRRTRAVAGRIARGALLVLAGWGSALAATPLPSTGCGRTLASGSYALADQGLTRRYRLHVPSHYDPMSAHPLVVVFHGWGGDEHEFLGEAGVESLADERGYIVVAPRGLGSGAPDGRRNSWSFRGSTSGVASAGEGATASAPVCDAARTRDYTYPSCAAIARSTCSWTQCQADDVAFTLALLAEVEARLCVDRARVYATGGSNGGMFTWQLGQDERSAASFRAIAPIIGLPHRGYDDGPATTGHLPVLLVTGREDPTVPPGAWEDAAPTTTGDGDRYHYSSATAMTRRWGNANGCAYRGESARSFAAGTSHADCRTYCAGDPAGWSGGAAGEGWPNVLDCRAPMRHDYGLAWSWKLVLDFLDAQR
jgi:poly(3-hydroxybutyrate) depolymerase